MDRIRILPVLVLLGCLAVPSFGLWAEPGEFVPYVSVRQEYSDNIYFSSTDEEESYLTTATAGLLYDHKSERVTAQVDGRANRLIYWKHDDLNDTEGRAFARIDYLVTERAGIGGSVEYRQDSRKDQDSDDSGLMRDSLGEQEVKKGDLSSSYMFSEITRGEISVGYENTTLEDMDQDEEDDTISVNLALTRNISEIWENTTALLNFSYMHYTSDEQTALGSYRYSLQDYEADVYQLYAGISRQATELLSYYFQIGASYTDSTQSQDIKSIYQNYNILLYEDDYSDDTFGTVLISGLDYKGLYTDAGISLSHDVRGGTGTTGTVERTRASINISRRITENFSFTLETSVILNTSERELEDNDVDTLTVHFMPGFRYKFADTWLLTGAYRYTNEDDREVEETSERNLFYFTIRKEFEL